VVVCYPEAWAQTSDGSARGNSVDASEELSEGSKTSNHDQHCNTRSAGNQPFYCCVRVVRQQLPSTVAAARQAPPSVTISLHTPLTIQSALPFAANWTLLSSMPDDALRFATYRGANASFKTVSIYLSIYLSICLSVYLSVYLSIYLCNRGQLDFAVVDAG